MSSPLAAMIQVKDSSMYAFVGSQCKLSQNIILFPKFNQVQILFDGILDFEGRHLED